MTVCIRKATASDVPRLREIIEASVRGLQAADYSLPQIEGALQSVYGVDSQLIADGTYLVAEEMSDTEPVIVACGGWSKHKTLYGGDQYAGREDSLLDPSRDAAKIRAFFVHPAWARPSSCPARSRPSAAGRSGTRTRPRTGPPRDR